jgi:hypothetical protein
VSWKCNICRGSRVAFDFSSGSAEPIGCLECSWSKVVGGSQGWGMRCVEPTVQGGRCGREADLGGHCWQHADKHAAWDVVYARFRNSGDDDIPEAYREFFVRACQDVNLLERGLRAEDGLPELARQAVRLRIEDHAQRQKIREARSVVYFMRREGLIKIGTSRNVAKRQQEISRGSCMAPGMTVGPVELLVAVPGDRDLEGQLHSQFEDSRIPGTEWFRTTPRLLRLIARFQRKQECQAAA